MRHGQRIDERNSRILSRRAIRRHVGGECARAGPGRFSERGNVRIIVPFAAGGPTDVVARILGDLLSARWGGKSVIIDNRPGAGAIVATAAVAKAPPDGHTFLMATNSLLINPALDMKLPYDTYKDLTGVSMVATQPVALVANKDFPADTLGEVIAEAKKRGGKLDYTSRARAGSGISPARC